MAVLMRKWYRCWLCVRLFLENFSLNTFQLIFWTWCFQTDHEDEHETCIKMILLNVSFLISWSVAYIHSCSAQKSSFFLWLQVQHVCPPIHMMSFRLYYENDCKCQSKLYLTLISPIGNAEIVAVFANCKSHVMSTMTHMYLHVRNALMLRLRCAFDQLTPASILITVGYAPFPCTRYVPDCTRCSTCAYTVKINEAI